MRNYLCIWLSSSKCHLTLKAPITTAADAKFFDIFPNFEKDNHENRLPAGDSHKISCLICYL